MSLLLDRLRGAGDFDSEGCFTVDMERARDKMARFQLTDPGRYVLEFLAAAVACGPTRIDISSQESLEILFDGAPIPAVGLEQLEDYLLAGSQGPASDALAHLAVGINALMGLKPTEARVETPEGAVLVLAGGTRRLESGRFERHRILVAPARRFLRKTSFDEQREHLRRDASLSPVPTFLDGQDLRQPPTAPEYTLSPEPVEVSDSRGRIQAWLDPDGAGTRLGIVRHGVVVARRELARNPPLSAWLWNDRLSLNASHSDVVEDAVYDSALDLLAQVGNRALEELAARAAADGFAQVPAERFLLRQLPLHPELPGLREAPLFCGPCRARHSLAQLREQAAKLGFLPTTELTLEFEPEMRIVRVQGVRAELGQLGFNLKDVGPDLMRELTTRNNRERWEQAARPAELPPGNWLVCRRIETGDYQGEVGLEASDTDAGSLLHLLYRGRLLETRELASPLSYVAVLDFPELKVREDWAGADPRDRLVKRALEQLEEAGSELVRELAGRPEACGPGRREHVLLGLAKDEGNPGPLAAVAVFRTPAGDMLSLDQLHKAETIGLVKALEPPLPDNVPESALLDYPVLQRDPYAEPALRAQLGNRLQDVQAEFDRLRQLSAALAAPRTPTLSPRHFTWEQQGIKFQLAFEPEGSSRAQLDLYVAGVRLETRSVRHRAWPYRALVESPRLKATPSWRGVQADRGLQEVMERLPELERRAWKAALADLWHSSQRLGVWVPAIRRALQVYGLELRPEADALPLFEARVKGGGQRMLSLEDLDYELAARGRLWAGPQYLAAEPDGVVLFNSDRALLEALGYKVADWKARPTPEPGATPEPSPLTPPSSAAVSAPSLDLTLPESVSISAPLPSPRRGQVGLLRLLEGGWIRLAGGSKTRRLEGVLPRIACAVVETTAPLSPAGSTRLIQEIRQVVDTLVKERVTRVAAGEPEAFALLTLGGSSEGVPGLVREAPLLKLLSGECISLNDLKQRLAGLGHKSIPCVARGTRGEPLDGRPVVVADATERWLLSQVAGRVVDDLAELKKDDQRRGNLAAAARLKKALPACLLERELQGEALTGKIGLPLDPRKCGLNLFQGERPLGVAPRPDVAGYLSGTFGHSDMYDTVWLDRDQLREVNDTATELFSDLVEAFPALSGKPREVARRQLLVYLTRNRRELGGNSRRADTLSRLAQLPLFPVAGGRLASAAALLEEAQGCGKVLYLRRPGPPEPGLQRLLPVLAAGSVELAASIELLGARRLEELNRPGLIARGIGWLEQTASGWWKALDQSARGVESVMTRALTGFSRAVGASAVPPAQAPEPKRPEREEKETPEQRFLACLRREISLICPVRPRGPWMRLVEGAVVTRSLIPRSSPAVEWDAREGRMQLNAHHPMIDYAIRRHSEDPGAVVLVAVHLFCAINELLDEVTDEHEMSFLVSLSRSLSGSFQEEAK